MIAPLRNISFKLILISIFLIPVTVPDYRMFLNLGEFRNETYIYPVLIAIVIFILNSLLKGKVNIPKRSPYFILIISLVIWGVFTFIFNAHNIVQSNFKDTMGVPRFFKQLLSLILVVLVIPIVLFNVFKDISQSKLFQKIENVITWSLIFVFSFAVLQILSVNYQISFAHEWIDWINKNVPIIYLKEDIFFQRISSVSHEPPFLGMYLIFVAPWLMRGLIINNKKKKFALLFIMLLILVFYSKSRAAQLGCIIEIVIFFTFLIFNQSKAFVKFIKATIIVAMLLPFILLWKGGAFLETIGERIDSFKIVKNISTNNSNKTRMGTIVAGMKTFSEHPITGVGYGQQGYYLINSYPKWAVEGNWEIKRYLGSEEKNFPPGFNIYVRLLAETGLIGFGIFMMFILSLLYINLKYFLQKKDINYLFFLTGFFGFMINWIQIDTPRIYGFWIIFTLFLIYHTRETHGGKRINSIDPTL